MKQGTVIRIDGECSKSGIIGRGVKQGCLLSPLLFSLCIKKDGRGSGGLAGRNEIRGVDSTRWTLC